MWNRPDNDPDMKAVVKSVLRRETVPITSKVGGAGTKDIN